MRYANKLMVVPFTDRIKDPSIGYLHGLDDEMFKIIHNKGLQSDEKVKLYNLTLAKFMTGMPGTSEVQAATQLDGLPEPSTLNKLKKKFHPQKKEEIAKLAHVDRLKAAKRIKSRSDKYGVAAEMYLLNTPTFEQSAAESKLNVNNAAANTTSEGLHIEPAKGKRVLAKPKKIPSKNRKPGEGFLLPPVKKLDKTIELDSEDDASVVTVPEHKPQNSWNPFKSLI